MTKEKTIKKFRVERIVAEVSMLADNLDRTRANNLAREKNDSIEFHLPGRRIEYRVIPYVEKIPERGLPEIGDALYVPNGIKETVNLCRDNKECIMHIKGGMAFVSRVEKCYKGWTAYFDELGGAGYEINRLLDLQEDLEKRLKTQKAEPIFDSKTRESREYWARFYEFHDNFGGDWK